MSKLFHTYNVELKRIFFIGLGIAGLFQVLLCRQVIFPWMVSNTGASVTLGLFISIVLGLAIKVYYRTIIVRYKSGGF